MQTKPSHYAQTFDRLFDLGSDVVLGGTHEFDGPPADGDARWGISVNFRPDPSLSGLTARLSTEALDLVGPDHWPTGNKDAVHLTVRALEQHRSPVPNDDDATARYAQALRRAVDRCPGSVRFAFTGLTLTPTCVMACVEPLDAAADRFASALAEELGPDGWYEMGFNRNIWYASLVHFTGPIADPRGLVEWVRARRLGDLEVNHFAATAVELIRWSYNGRQVLPVGMAVVPLPALG